MTPRLKMSCFVFFCIAFLSSLSLAQTSVLQNDRFESLGIHLDPWAQSQVQFWVKVFTEYDTHHSIFHDSVNLKRIYCVSPPEKGTSTEIRNRIHHDLLSIYTKNAQRKTVDIEKLSPDEFRDFEIHEANEDPKAYEYASSLERIRMQIGQKDRLENAYSISRRYLPRMEEMFVEEGVPKELTRLPFIESGFVKDARSSVGAIGIWQFMPKTALKDLRVDAAIDERYDPLKATRAAARFLKQNHKLLKSWSLAIMAYHHGPGLVQKAVKRLKTTDPIQIVRVFKHADFQFASRNYLFEFLAMLDVDSMHALFFKPGVEAKLPAFITVSFPTPVFMNKILTFYTLNEELTRVLNPHFKQPIWDHSLPIPAHYPVRLTGITLEQFRSRELH